MEMVSIRVKLSLAKKKIDIFCEGLQRGIYPYEYREFFSSLVVAKEGKFFASYFFENNLPRILDLSLFKFDCLLCKF